tara:strand:- start:75 stop:296 length:222 start_codon:yes stop_codon:yes gene_type:complete
MNIIKIKKIGWVIVPIRNTNEDVIYHYDSLSKSVFKDLYSENIIEDVDGRPNLIKINKKFKDNHQTLNMFELM